MKIISVVLPVLLALAFAHLALTEVATSDVIENLKVSLPESISSSSDEKEPLKERAQLLENFVNEMTSDVQSQLQSMTRDDLKTFCYFAFKAYTDGLLVIFNTLHRDIDKGITSLPELSEAVLDEAGSNNDYSSDYDCY